MRLHQAALNKRGVRHWRRAAPLLVVAAVLWVAWTAWSAWRAGSVDRSQVYTIGSDNAYPYHYLRPGETKPHGMIGDLMNEAARRSGIKLEWRLHPEGPTRALQKRTVQIWPLLSAQPSIWPDFHFTEPYLRNTYVALRVVSPGAPDTAGQPVRRLALTGSAIKGKGPAFPLVYRLAKSAFPTAEPVLRPSRSEAMAALCKGQADAMLTESRAAQYLALHRPPECAGHKLEAMGLDLPPAELAIASLREQAAVADRLRQEIDAMVDDGTVARLLGPWDYYYSGEAEALHRELEAQTARNRSYSLAGALGLSTLLLLVLLARVRRVQRAAQAANAAKSQFLASMSHEIRTPLHGILGVGQLLSGTALQAQQREYLDMIVASGKVLLGLVNDLLDLARVERGNFPLEPVSFSPAELIEDCARVYRIEAEQKGLSFRLEGTGSLPPRAWADASRIRQVLANLLANAVKFTRSGSVEVTVSVGGAQGAERLRVLVRDTGIGIPASSQKRLFEKFYQADNRAGGGYGGTGLGLAIARELVTAMGGEIGFESEPGTGSAFHFDVPLRCPNWTPQEQYGVAHEPTAAPAATPARILLVEDNVINQRIALTLLEKAGHDVVCAADGEAAVLRWHEDSFDAVLMDCQMPVMDGYEATAEIRRLESSGRDSRRTPIIALTAAAMQSERERCLAAGMDDFLAKPIDLLELHRVLNSWVGGDVEKNTAAKPSPAAANPPLNGRLVGDPGSAGPFAVAATSPPPRHGRVRPQVKSRR